MIQFSQETEGEKGRNQTQNRLDKHFVIQKRKHISISHSFVVGSQSFHPLELNIIAFTNKSSHGYTSISLSDNCYHRNFKSLRTGREWFELGENGLYSSPQNCACHIKAILTKVVRAIKDSAKNHSLAQNIQYIHIFF